MACLPACLLYAFWSGYIGAATGRWFAFQHATFHIMYAGARFVLTTTTKRPYFAQNLIVIN